jgi:hypothetical protein
MTVDLVEISQAPNGAEAVLSVDGEKRRYSFETEMIDLQGQNLELLKADRQLFSDFKFNQAPYHLTVKAVRRFLNGENLLLPQRLLD